MSDFSIKSSLSNSEIYPSLPLAEWQDTNDTLHLWTQIVGKIRLTQTLMINQWWNATLYLTPHGLTTSAMPYKNESFAIDFDFVNHQLLIRMSFNQGFSIKLEPMSVADFYKKLFNNLKSNGIEIEIKSTPDELENPIPFAEDTTHNSYDAEYANRFWRVLLKVDQIFKQFRSRFGGKCSPVHFFWGSFDLAVTRFSGKDAPPRENADRITRIAYDREVISHGFWTGKGLGEAAFYAYAAPSPEGFGEQNVLPDAAFYSKEMSEYFLKYEDVRKLENPDQAILDFMQSTYEVGANLAKWDRENLEIDWSKILKGR
jgi:hypothetical protein